jgi:hypothetical protein
MGHHHLKLPKYTQQFIDRHGKARFYYRRSPRCRMHGLKKGGMRRLAEAGNTTHELMAISGHKTLTEVQRYTDEANKLKLAQSGMTKQHGQSVNIELSNLASKVSNRHLSR